MSEPQRMRGVNVTGEGTGSSVHIEAWDLIPGVIRSHQRV